MSKKVIEIIDGIKELFLFSPASYGVKARKFLRFSKELYREAKTEADRDGISDCESWLQEQRRWTEARKLRALRDTLEG